MLRWSLCYKTLVVLSSRRKQADNLNCKKLIYQFLILDLAFSELKELNSFLRWKFCPPERGALYTHVKCNGREITRHWILESALQSSHPGYSPRHSAVTQVTTLRGVSFHWINYDLLLVVHSLYNIHKTLVLHSSSGICIYKKIWETKLKCPILPGKQSD